MLVVIGRVGRAHGIRGDVNVDIRTDEPERRFAPGSSVIIGSRTLTIKAVRHHSGKLIVTFAEITDRTMAEGLSGSTIETEIDEAERPEDPEEFYDHQLIGLDVRVGDEVVGTVSGISHQPGHDLLELNIDDRTVLVPFAAALVPEVDIHQGFVLVRDIPGLLDPDAADVAGQG